MGTDHVQVNIAVDNVGITRNGYGKPMIVSHKAAFAERYREYASALEVASDFATTSPEYRCANAYFSQTPKPPLVGIGKADSDVTLTYTLNAAGDGLSPLSSYEYKLTVAFEGGADTELTFTSDASATADEIHAGLVAALNGVAGKNYTAATSAGNPVTITGNTANAWFAISVGDKPKLAVRCTAAAPAGLTDDLNAILDDEDSFYEVHVLYPSKAIIVATSAWAESAERIHTFDTPDTDVILISYSEGVTTDVGSTLLGTGPTATMGGYHHSPYQFWSAGWMGRWLPTTPGQATAKFKTVAGASTLKLTATQKANLRARRMNGYTKEWGRSICWEGTVFSTVYQYLDVRRNVHWLTDEVRKAVFGVLVGSDIVPYTPEGIAKCEGAVRGSVELAEDQGVLSDGTGAVEAPEIEDVPDADKVERNLKTLKFSGTLAGAIHKAIPINGTVTF